MTAIRKRPDGRYDSRPIIDGRKHYILRDTKGAVERELSALKLAAHRRRLGLPDDDSPPEDVTYDDLCGRFLAQYQRSDRSRKTLIERLAYSRRAFGGSLIRDVTPEVLVEWNKNLTVGATTKHNAWRAASQVLRYAVRRRWLRENPTIHVEVPGPARRIINPFASWAEAHAAAAKAGEYGPLIRFGTATGLRPQEWQALTWANVDVPGRSLTVEQTVRSGRIQSETKTDGSRRVVRLQQEALDALADIARPISGGLVFTSPDGEVINLSNFRKRVWKPALAAAGIEYRALDQMRHSFATLALAAGADLAWVSAQLGHSKIQTTLTHYARWLPAADDRNLAALDAFAVTDRTETGQSKEASGE